jgi:hypothetical protein
MSGGLDQMRKGTTTVAILKLLVDVELSFQRGIDLSQLAPYGAGWLAE